MATDLKKMYKTVMADSFPAQMEISFKEGNQKQTIYYEKVRWEIKNVKMGLRYGENPGQEAALYKPVNGNLVLGEARMLQPGRYLVSDIELLQSGKHPGKTNLTDADNGLNILRYLGEKPTAVIIKHNNPCGAAQSDSLEQAYHKAYMADRVAAFGGCITVNQPVDKATAEAVCNQYAEVLTAPDYEDGVMAILAEKKNLRVVKINNMARLQHFAGQRVVDFKTLVDGGIIAQWSFVPTLRTKDDFTPARCEYKNKTYAVNRMPTEKEYEDMLFGWFVETGVTSNSVIYVKDLVTVGIGTGEQDRVGVAEIARDKAYRKLADRYCFEKYQIPYHELTDKDLKHDIDATVSAEKGGLIGASMISDAFFPFRDGVDVGIREKITAIVQPGGSENDYQSIEACNESNVAMVYTGQRCFKH